MLELIAFVIALAFTLAAAIAIFLEKSMLRAVVALALAMTGSAVLMFGIGESMIALLQLLIFVGGLSTYLLVAIAPEKRRPTGRAWFIGLAVVLALSLAAEAYYASGYVMAVPGTGAIQSYAGYAFQSYYAVLYVIAFALFTTAIGSVLVIRKFTRLIV